MLWSNALLVIMHELVNHELTNPGLILIANQFLLKLMINHVPRHVTRESSNCSGELLSLNTPRILLLVPKNEPILFVLQYYNQMLTFNPIVYFSSLKLSYL